MIRKVAAWLIAAFVLIGLAAAFGQRFIAGPVTPSEMGNPDAPSSTPAAVVGGKSSEPLANIHAPASRSGSSTQTAEVRSGIDEAAAPSAATIAGRDLETSRSGPDGEPHALEDRDSVVGIPFPVSSSVAKVCQEFQDSLCEEVRGTLAQMAKEARDPSWSVKMEAALRDRVMTPEPGKFAIRALECRTSACALEVESIYGPYLGGANTYDFDKVNGIETGPPQHAYERDKDGNRVTVTLITYNRR